MARASASATVANVFIANIPTAAISKDGQQEATLHGQQDRNRSVNSLANKWNTLKPQTRLF